MFNLFKKKSNPIREFSSDADRFSTNEIWEWMEKCYSSDEIIPPLRDDSYVKSMIERMSEESDIEILNDSEGNGVRTIQLAITRNGKDYVSVAYQQFNPYVVYITTSPFGFAGDGKSFMAYCNEFQKAFPMITIGIVNQEIPIKLPDGSAGSLKNEMYTVRTLIPLLGNKQDYENLLTATRCLPIYGYDLRDGYHEGNFQPYRTVKSGINVQLEKLVKIHSFPGVKDLCPCSEAFYGSSPNSEHTIDHPAFNSNPYFQYFNYCCIDAHKNHSHTLNFMAYVRTEKDKDTDTLKRASDHQLVCYPNFPSLFSLEVHQIIQIEDKEELNGLFELIGNLSASHTDHNPDQYALYQAGLSPYSEDGKSHLLTLRMTQCLPNEVNSECLAYQIEKFLNYFGEKLDQFKPESYTDPVK